MAEVLCQNGTEHRMLATLSDDVARKVDRDRRVYGVGFVRFDADGRAHHVPAPDVSLRRMAERR